MSELQHEYLDYNNVAVKRLVKCVTIQREAFIGMCERLMLEMREFLDYHEKAVGGMDSAVVPSRKISAEISRKMIEMRTTFRLLMDMMQSYFDVMCWAHYAGYVDDTPYKPHEPSSN